MPDGPETEQPEEPKPEKPDKPSKPEDLDENDCIIFSDAVLEKGLLAIKPSIDLNGDGKISLSEAAEVREINLSFEAPQDSGENLVGGTYPNSNTSTSLKNSGLNIIKSSM